MAEKKVEYTIDEPLTVEDVEKIIAFNQVAIMQEMIPSLRKGYAKYSDYFNKIDSFLKNCQAAIMRKDFENVLHFFLLVKNLVVDLKCQLKIDKETEDARDKTVEEAFSLVNKERERITYDEELMLVLTKMVEKQLELLHETFQVAAGHSFDLKIPTGFISTS